MTTITTGPVRPGSAELRQLLADIAAGASEREAKRIAPHEQVRQLADAGVGRFRIPVEDGGAGATRPTIRRTSRRRLSATSS